MNKTKDNTRKKPGGNDSSILSALESYFAIVIKSEAIPTNYGNLYKILLSTIPASNMSSVVFIVL